MHIEITFPFSDAKKRVYLTWRPMTARVKLVDPRPDLDRNGTIKVRFRSTAYTVTASRNKLHKNGTPQTAKSGRLHFHPVSGSPRKQIDLDIPVNGTEVDLKISGRIEQIGSGSSATIQSYPSNEYGDVRILANEIGPGPAFALLDTFLLNHKLMVRVRKNANNLFDEERNRFLSALMALNGGGSGIIQQLRDTHVDGLSAVVYFQLHENNGFLPWHRAFILDLERELQKIDQSVTLPYWRFDQAAPYLISRAFLGLPDGSGEAKVNPSNPLVSWTTDGAIGILRGNGVQGSTVPSLHGEDATLALGTTFSAFKDIELNPHGSAHMAHGTGVITSTDTAGRDPLFYLLHCNVDRLWAKWQWLKNRHDPDDTDSYDDSTTVPSKGHNLGNTLWPWDNDRVAPRPNFAPRTPMPDGSMTNAPGPTPTINQMIDYFAMTGGNDLGFAYDDVPYET